MMTIKSQTAPLDLGYDDQGHGSPTLLFLTGWCSSRARWARVAELCAERHRTLNFDWRGHGDSDAAPGDFGVDELVEDALSLLDARGVDSFIPCSASHSGWVAIELRRRVPERVERIVHLDWMVAEPSVLYMNLLEQLQSSSNWAGARDALFEIWRGGVELGAVEDAIAVMTAQGQDMWMRSGRVIESSYRQHGSPLAALAALDTPPPALHVYGQPRSPEYLELQRAASTEHPWFSVDHLDVRSHFSMIEAPAAVAASIERFVTGRL
jgi:pimeloyl-ACP methyl ester carboxylesterase